jgi:hypothetical protein
MNDDRYLYVAVSLDIGAPAGVPDGAQDMLTLWFEDEPPVGDGKWPANLCNQPDEGRVQSPRAYTPVDDDDADYFIPSAEHWCIAQVDPPGYRRAFGRGSANWEVRMDLRTSALDVAPGDCFNAGLLLSSNERYFDPELAEQYGAAEWPQGLFDEDEQKPDWPGRARRAQVGRIPRTLPLLMATATIGARCATA